MNQQQNKFFTLKAKAILLQAPTEVRAELLRLLQEEYYAEFTHHLPSAAEDVTATAEDLRVSLFQLFNEANDSKYLMPAQLMLTWFIANAPKDVLLRLKHFITTATLTTSQVTAKTTPSSLELVTPNNLLEFPQQQSSQ